MSAELHTVHVRVNDAATGQPTPCRIRFTDAAGNYYAPFGRVTHFPPDPSFDDGGNVLINEELHAYIDGTCEIQLPPGPIRVAISKGPEYQPVHHEVSLMPGKLALRFELKRWIDLRRERWYSGDTHAWNLSPHTALLEGAGEDLAVINLLIRGSWFYDHNNKLYPLFPNITAFSGQRPALEIPGHMVVVNTINFHPQLGTLLLLNCHRVVYPLFFGIYPDDYVNWTLTAWCDQCHRKGGLVVGEGFFTLPLDFGHFGHGELLADLLLGKVDALELGDFDHPETDAEFGPEARLDGWYSLLDCGYRISLVGGSGKMSHEEWLGSVRTYARLEEGQEFSYRNWIEAIRAGRTFVTTGPLLSLTVNGADPGAVIKLLPDQATVRVRAEARSQGSFDRLEVLVNHCVVSSAAPSGSPASALIEADIPLSRSGWLVARCWGPRGTFRAEQTAAQSSAVYVEIVGRPRQVDSARAGALIGDVEKSLRWVRDKACCETDKQRQDLLDIFQNARQNLLHRLGVTP